MPPDTRADALTPPRGGGPAEAHKSESWASELGRIPWNAEMSVNNMVEKYLENAVLQRFDMRNTMFCVLLCFIDFSSDVPL